MAIPKKRYVTHVPKNVVALVLARLRSVANQGNMSFNDILQYVIERFVLWCRNLGILALPTRGPAGSGYF